MKTNPNPRLTIIRIVALLGVLPGLGLVLMGIAVGRQNSTPIWLLAAVLLVALGLVWAWKALSYFKNPSPRAARDLLSLFSYFVFSALFSTIKRHYPDVWGIPGSLGIASDNVMMVTMLIALVVAWAAHRLLKKYLIEPAFVSSTKSSAG